MTLLLNESDVRALLKMPELIETMERTLAQFSTGRARQPVRTAIEVNERDFFGIMPAQLESPAALGAKLVTVFHGNEQRGLPSHLAVIVLLDPATGRLEAVMDGRYITAMRTAAASAVAVRWLAHANAAILAILGSGVQARSHLELLPLVRNFGEARVWSPNAGHLAQFLDSAGSTAGISIPVRAAVSAEAAVRGVDVIVLATSSGTPVIHSDWLKPGALVISVGACRPNMREMDPALVATGRLIVDSKAAALIESGDVVHGIREGLFREDHIVAELGQVLAKQIAGRTSTGQRVIFKSLGIAVEDVAAAEFVYACALREGKGKEFSFS
ncbi:MAG: ornithine cyclodeaminase [Acidobacteria bacterium]|nr:MAG: ornithine cyclodeaminase [Acidobacteriota bacterium]